MVRLMTLSNPFHARVVAARLGAEGVLAQLQGNVDGPYPMGDVHVYVEAGELDAAKELLLADEVESAFEGNVDVDDRTPRELWLVVVAILLVAGVMFARNAWWAA